MLKKINFKLKNTWKTSSKGKRAYLIIWILAAFFLLILVIQFPVLKNRIGEKNDDGRWSYSVNETNFRNLPPGTSIGGPDTVKVTLKSGATAPSPAPTDLTLKGIETIYNAPEIYVIDETTNFGVYSFNSFNASATSAAKAAQNSIATNALLFGISLTAGIFTTVIVEWKRKKVKSHE